jgi:hypothetical protein
MTAQRASWDDLGRELRAQIDELLCARKLLPAIMLLRREGGLQPPLGLYEAQDLLVDRRVELNRQGLVEPEPPPPTTEQIIAEATAITAPVAAIEALWNGDTQGWYVCLVAIVRRPSRHNDRFDEVPLTVLRNGGDIRLFNGQAPPWDESEQATEQGRAVAQRLGVPFHFTSADTPDIDLPRWWDTTPS